MRPRCRWKVLLSGSSRTRSARRATWRGGTTLRFAAHSTQWWELQLEADLPTTLPHAGGDHHSRRVAFATLGCKLNQHETDSIATAFSRAGYRIVDFNDSADAYVLNTCTVTNRADRKSRNLAGRALRTAPSHAIVVVTGCYVDSHRDELESDGRTIVVANEDKHAVFELVDAHFRGEVARPHGSVFDFDTPDQLFHTRTTIKVQDGCDNFCTFCIIPAVRGRAQSRPVDAVESSVAAAVDTGAREVVLTGVNMSRYAAAGVDFTGLVERVLAVPGDFRVRISSLEPDRLTDRFFALFSDPKLAPHLHLCLQSGSDRVLLAMRRQYTFDEYVRAAQSLRAIDPLFNLTTDIIVGFPGETDADFQMTLDAIDRLCFGHVHTFIYSVRRGTRAERMPGHLPASVATERSARVRQHADRAKRSYRSSLVGLRQRLLVERVDGVQDRVRLTGLGQHYVPVRVDGLSGDWHANRFVDVAIDSIDSGDDPALLASPIP
ncbi:MAG: tRNA (N(6)-L-threonylcarbamoyladenosine(37)-C(2))-methylthiotransferase MtaB [Spirochaetaceae bacterium]|nr:MAG: tRNA (N(6)-L-threonylcarbamoyladenosine(37)-C(2))-methylthiotransferase MtaB [Spirochaetaceae bacterium]